MVATSHCIRQQFSLTEHFHTPRLTRTLSRLGTKVTDIKQSTTYSLTTLFCLVTFACVTVSLMLLFGPSVLVLWLVALVVCAGVTAHHANNPVPFWKCVGSMAILMYLLPPLGYQPTEFQIIFDTFVFALGAYLGYACLRDGHWSSCMLSMAVLIPYFLYACMLALTTIQNWGEVVRYWTT